MERNNPTSGSKPTGLRPVAQPRVIPEMNKQEAKDIASKQLEAYRSRPYKELSKMIKAEPINFQVRGLSGVSYNIEIQAFWDDKPNGNIRVMCSIDDGGWRSYSPMNTDFIKSPADEFVGE